MEELKESILTLSKFYGIEPTELIYFLERNTSNEKNVMIPKTLRETNQYLLETCKD
jgi:FKBP-type peptidyl-prolyl cis-trans isomerase (trigger factor)